MTRIRLRTGPAAIFGVVLVAALLLLLPMRLALGWFGADAQGLAARAVTGSLWSGTLHDTRFGGLALGDLDASLSPFALLVGRATIRLDDQGTTSGLHGSVSVSRHGYGIDALSVAIPTGAVFAPLPVVAIDLDGVSVRFRDGQCLSADGRVRATLSGGAGGIVLPPSVAGNARCDGGALLLPLASQSGNEAVDLRITGQGSYTANLSMRPTDPQAIARLEAAGFVGGPQGYRLSIEGRF